MKLILLSISLIGIALGQQSPLEEFTEGNVEFSARLYKELLKDHKDSFIASPFSAQVVLALTQMGAEGPTAAEFSTGLNLPANKRAVQEALLNYLPGLTRDDEKIKILSANKVYVKNGFKIKDSFKQTAVNVFKSDVENVDFTKSQEAADIINKWVESRTNNRIKDLVNSDVLDADTRLILVNALYFSAPWAQTFEHFLTQRKSFFTSETDKVEVDMMTTTESFKYYEDKANNVKYLELDYEDPSGVSMTIVLPNEKTGLTRMEHNIQLYFQPVNYTYERVHVQLPKFQIETEIGMKEVLERLGLKKVFSNEADLSGISDVPLKVSDVVQKAFIKVDEEGTEAAAATYVGVSLLSAPSAPRKVPARTFIADRPFLFIVRDTRTGAALFIGKFNRR